MAAAARNGAGLVNGISAEELMDCWEASGSAYDAGILGSLWASVPPEMRLVRLSVDAVPGHWRGGFAGDGRSYPLVAAGVMAPGGRSPHPAPRA